MSLFLHFQVSGNVISQQRLWEPVWQLVSVGHLLTWTNISAVRGAMFPRDWQCEKSHPLLRRSLYSGKINSRQINDTGVRTSFSPAFSLQPSFPRCLRAFAFLCRLLTCFQCLYILVWSHSLRREPQWIVSYVSFWSIIYFIYCHVCVSFKNCRLKESCNNAHYSQLPFTP